MAEKDMTEKLLEDYNDVFADIVNVLLFDGKQIISQDCLTETNVKSHYKADEGKLHEQERDIAKYWEQGGVKIAIYGLENQTTVDKDMPLRIINYDGAFYRSQLLHEEEGRYPVISLVLYFGEGHWKKSKTLKEILSIPEELEPYFSDYKINVFEIPYLTEKQVNMFTSDFKIIADYFVQTRKNKEYIPSQQVIKHVDAFLKMMAVFTGDARYEEICKNNISKEEGMTMCKAMDAAEERGMKQGKMELLTEQIRKKLIKGQTIEQIAEDLVEDLEKVRELAEKIVEE